jgi:hypothetical protein
MNFENTAAKIAQMGTTETTQCWLQQQAITPISIQGRQQSEAASNRSQAEQNNDVAMK